MDVLELPLRIGTLVPPERARTLKQLLPEASVRSYGSPEEVLERAVPDELDVVVLDQDSLGPGWSKLRSLEGWCLLVVLAGRGKVRAGGEVVELGSLRNYIASRAEAVQFCRLRRLFLKAADAFVPEARNLGGKDGVRRGPDSLG